MTEHIANDGTVVKEQGNGKPLPDNTKVFVTILPSRKGGNSIERRPFARQGDNVGITALNIRTEIHKDNQRGGGRNLFSDIPLARKFASGNAAFDFFGFFRALGYDVDAAEGFTVPEDRELIGKGFTAVLGIDESGDEPRNEIKFFNKADGIPDNTALFARADAAEKAGPTAVPATTGATASTPTTGWTPPAATAQSNEQQAAVAAPAAPVTWSPPTAAQVDAEVAATPVPNDAAALANSVEPTF